MKLSTLPLAEIKGSPLGSLHMVKIFCFNYKMQTFSYFVEPPGSLVQDRKTKTGSGTAKWRKKRGGGRERGWGGGGRGRDSFLCVEKGSIPGETVFYETRAAQICRSSDFSS